MPVRTPSPFFFRVLRALRVRSPPPSLPARLSISRQHRVDNYASDRHIEPNWECESGQTPVRGKPTAEREKKSDEDHRQGHHRETDVRDEQRKVDVTNHPWPVKAHVAMEGVIRDVGDEEKRGKDESREHGCPVIAHAPGPDEAETGDQGHGRKGVEEGVQRGKEEQVGARNIGRRMIIDKPAEKGAGPRANGNDGGDDAERGTVLVGGECRHGGKGKEHRFSSFANSLMPSRDSACLSTRKGCGLTLCLLPRKRCSVRRLSKWSFGGSDTRRDLGTGWGRQTSTR
jgi:hypothetical protein